MMRGFQEEEGSTGSASSASGYRLLDSPTNSTRGSSPSIECRICGGGQVEDLGELISPCVCKGSLARVHTECLEKWILARPNTNSQHEMLVCEICNSRYRVSLVRSLSCDTENLCSWSALVHSAEALTLTCCIACVLYIFVLVFPSFASETDKAGLALIVWFLLILLFLSLFAFYRLIRRWYKIASTLAIV